MEYRNRIGAEASMAFNPAAGDRTRFNEVGARATAALAVARAPHAVGELQPYPRPGG